ncbi:hypothetical protein AO382_1321 [Moraxella catarrhalis]|uniref:Uncharacterized protein n=1 Tax=Moraxella catarrhalis TaxID=480 RepID=A0A7Z1A438_MORCA|nr:hypothetical protein AO382_1321 [Moraxella catarrhalis]
MLSTPWTVRQSPLTDQNDTFDRPTKAWAQDRESCLINQP